MFGMMWGIMGWYDMIWYGMVWFGKERGDMPVVDFLCAHSAWGVRGGVRHGGWWSEDEDTGYDALLCVARCGFYVYGFDQNQRIKQD